MINALPRWVELGALFLAALAGVVNAVGLGNLCVTPCVLSLSGWLAIKARF